MNKNFLNVVCTRRAINVDTTTIIIIKIEIWKKKKNEYNENYKPKSMGKHTKHCIHLLENISSIWNYLLLEHLKLLLEREENRFEQKLKKEWNLYVRNTSSVFNRIYRRSLIAATSSRRPMDAVRWVDGGHKKKIT